MNFIIIESFQNFLKNMIEENPFFMEENGIKEWRIIEESSRRIHHSHIEYDLSMIFFHSEESMENYIFQNDLEDISEGGIFIRSN